ncbi:hypothetical protein SAMN02745126_05956 [Enhydrobacter aerosaccus]|uniref:Uncharacterized protein n=1 Tax=Enhydrobacter aerosaccus TaxID=225324 RepID=A0A1T4TBK2_9HYPH|nr:hypothetical protein [Enhydrobacter aerosaccus]SKA37783.1 hypothetical protein SAMN02745126_05956 [Enhydrobacter aerosaccus]
MVTVTDICNAALSHCGTRSKISSIDEGSAEANACRTHLAMVRDQTLRLHDWNFARVTTTLALLQNPPDRWAYKYALPSDCVRLRRLNDVPLLALPEAFFEAAADKDSTGAFVGVILTNAAAVSAIYTAQVADPLRWDAGFADAVTYGLAARVCYELSGKEDRARTLTQLWQINLNQAAAAAANEGSALNRTYRPEALAARGYDDGLAEFGQFATIDTKVGSF